MNTRITLVIVLVIAVIAVGWFTVNRGPRVTTDLSGNIITDEREFFADSNTPSRFPSGSAEETDGASEDTAHNEGGDSMEPNDNPQTAPPNTPAGGGGKATKILITDGVKHTVPLGDILSGGPPQDGIPSIDNPTFISINEANEEIDDDGLGIAVSFNGDNRFYPNQILVWHEIVNDTVGGQAALVTYCPLCGTGIVFEPIVNGRQTEFGTSGKLWNSNLVMYDRQTQSYWSQVLGRGIVGEQAGTKLTLLPYQNMTYEDWKKEYPDGTVLSTDTGFFRNYNSDPYGSYYTDVDVFFPVDNTDSRYHPKAFTYGIEINGQFRVYPQEELAKTSGTITDTFAGKTLELSYNKDNQRLVITDTATGEEVVPVFGFWFSWISVHPETDVFTAS